MANPTTIPVELGKRSYPIHIQPGLLDNIVDLLSSLDRNQQWIIITQTSLLERGGRHLEEMLRNAGMAVKTIIIPTGESAKTISEIEVIYEQLVEHQADRSAMLLALGGGVVGDVTGFVAATFMRGIDYVQIPTTLLAMVDSAIGGKTGVNLPQGKNLVGAIYQPAMVCIDPTFLNSLPDRERISGLGEILKYGAIRDAEFFNFVSNNLSTPVIGSDSKMITRAIIRSCEIKTAVVEQDEREGDLRRILNFGHTLGHALEAYTGYTYFRHGEAVALGMLAAGWISHKRKILSDNELSRLSSAVNQLPLPPVPSLDPVQLLPIIRRDKKVRSGKLHMVLLNGLGKAVIEDGITDDEICQSTGIWTS